ncbi:MAG: hypothetical protein H6825_00750 [Planctomycetes bacterium]|nr:hypothetical protein [Planctomycetota bacterium]
MNAPEERSRATRVFALTLLLLGACEASTSAAEPTADDTQVAESTQLAGDPAATDASEATPPTDATEATDAATQAERAAAREAAARLAPFPTGAPPVAKGLYAGSWTIDAEHPFEHAWIDEEGLRETYTKRQAGRRTWAGMSSTDDFIPLDALVKDRTGPASAYFFTLVHRSPLPDQDAHDPASYPDVDAVLHVRHRGRVRVWFEGRLVVDAPAPPPGETREERVPVTCTGAFDVLLAKVARGSPELGDSYALDLRLGLPDGSPVPLQAWNTMRPSGYLSDLLPVEVGPPADG